MKAYIVPFKIRRPVVKALLAWAGPVCKLVNILKEIDLKLRKLS
jgi:hypothetical protein